MEKKSSLNIGNIGGDLNVGGDIVAGDKTTTSHKTHTTINIGFKKEEDKAEFAAQIEELLSMMRQIQSMIEGITGLDKGKKEEITDEIARQLDALKTAKEEGRTLPVGEEAPEDKAETLKGCLDKAGTFMKKLQKIGEKTVEFADKIIPLISKALPVLVNVRNLFGLP